MSRVAILLPQRDARRLPPGQYELDEFPRFGLTRFAERFPRDARRIQLRIAGEVEQETTISEEFLALPRVEQTSDFHCVTTWSRRSLCWSGFRFRDFFEQMVQVRARPVPATTFVVFRCQDGYAVDLPLSDLLAADVLLADRLDGEPLSIAHGAPLRLVAPAHYGYKSAKHLEGIDLRRAGFSFRPAAFRFMNHPRARVDLEERGCGAPGWLLRYLYRPLVRPTIRRFRRALELHLEQEPGAS